MKVSGYLQAPAASSPGKKNIDTHWMGCWVGPRGSLDFWRRGKSVAPAGIRTVLPSAVSLYRCNNTAILHYKHRHVKSVTTQPWNVKSGIQIYFEYMNEKCPRGGQEGTEMCFYSLMHFSLSYLKTVFDIKLLLPQWWTFALGWTVRGSNPGGGENFRTRPNVP